MTNHSYLYPLRNGKAFLLFLAFLLTFFSLDAQTTWTGAVDSDWANAANWSAGVPDATDVVTVNTTIPNAPIIGLGTAAVVKSISVNAPGSLTITANGSLTTHSTAPATNAVNVSGTLSNFGTINVENSTENAIVISFFPMGELMNNGNILIGQNGGNIGGSGILSSGFFENDSGQIVIDNVSGNGIQTASQFDNNADILIGQNGGSIGLAGIAVNTTGEFGHYSGDIIIDNTISDAVQNTGTFDTGGELLIGQNDGNIGGSGILTTGTFDNCAGCGPIQIGNTTLDGIRQEGGTFINNSRIETGRSGRSIGSAGIRVSNGSFTNESGLLIIDNTTVDGIINESQFTNQSEIEIGQNAVNIGANGIFSSGNFDNEAGQIEIDNVTENGILNAGSIENFAQILIGQNGGNIGGTGIFNFSDFTNETNALINIDNVGQDAIENTNTFINQAIIAIGLTGGNIVRFGIITEGVNSEFTNSQTGTINVRNTSSFPIYGEFSASMLNEGDITLEDDKVFTLGSNTVFTNAGCASFSTYGRIDGTGTFINDGFVTLNDATITIADFTNNGFVIYAQDMPPVNPLLSSVGISSLSTCSGFFDDALNLPNPLFTTVDNQWYLDEDLTDAAGSYSKSANRFTPISTLLEGLHTVYFSVTYNAFSCTQMVSVEIDLTRDNTPPTITCPPPSEFFASATDCFAQISVPTATATDNCDPNPVVMQAITGLTSGNFFAVGVYPVYFMAEDASNNESAICETSIIVTDNTNPTPICQDAIVVLNATGNGSITTAEIDNMSNDACGIASLSLDVTDFTCANVGDNTVTLTVTDNNGNSDTCTSTVDVQDNTSPMLICQDINIPLNVDGLASITPAQIDNGSNDACGIASLSLDNQYFTCAAVGDNSVTLSVTDVNGNSDTCTQTVTVEDNVPPVVLTQDITVELDNEGNVTITPAQVDNGSNDACGIASLALNLTEFNCGNVGPNTVVLTATDVNGNPNTETAIVNVVDLIPAEIECRQPVSTTNTPGVCGRNDLTVLPPFVLYDNCGIDNGITISRTPDINDFPIGTTVLTWTVTDSNGNPATCESLVIIEDTEAPTVGSCNTVIDFLEEGTCMAQVTVSVEAADNCGVPTVEGAGTFMLPLGIHPRTITITDENGNVTLHEITIYVHDDQSPELVYCPENIEFFTDGSSLDVDLPLPVFTDNCEISSLTNDAPEEFEEGNTEVTFTASDTYGNWVNCTYEVSVIPNMAFVDIIDEIEASTSEEDSISLVNWNGMQARSNCETCATTDYPEYIFLGDFNGHQYFLYNGSVSWSEAAVLSEEIDGHLVTINDDRENEFLEHYLPNFELEEEEDELSFWTGLNDSNIDIEWQNGDAFEYLNFPYDIVLQPDVVNATVMNEDGTWTMTTADNENSFIVERPCIDFTQTGPMVLEVSEEGDSTTTLLTPNTEWAVGEYVVTYEADDMCGNTATYSFDISVAAPNADYCSTGSTNHDIWMHEVTINDFFNGTGNNEGYADFTEEAISLEANNPITVQLYPVSLNINPTDKPLYMRIWADLNDDGDFFDDNEMVFETMSNDAAIAEFPYPTITEDTEMPIRVAVAEFQYPEVCADFTQGEVEDYLLFLPYVEEPHDDTRGSSSSVNIFPNPADEYVTVDLTDYEGQEVTIRVINQLGKVYQSARIDAATEKYRIDLQKFIDGMYFLEISTAGRRTVTEKLVIDKLYGWKATK